MPKNNSFSVLAEPEESVEEELPNTEATSKKKSANKKSRRQRKKQRDHEAKRLKEEEEEKARITMDVPNNLSNPEPIAAGVEAAADEEEDLEPNAPMTESGLNNPAETVPVAAAADEEDVDPNQFRENRLNLVESLKESGDNPYPHKFQVTMTIAEYIRKYDETLEAGQSHQDVIVSLSGRVMQKRVRSSELICYDLHGAGGSEVQLMVEASNSRLDVAKFTRLHSDVKRGDIVGVTGFPGRCERGELSLFPKYFVVLNKTLQMMPREKAGPGDDSSNIKKCDVWIPGTPRNPESYVLKDQETRYRQRYLDLMLNKEVPQIFKTRAFVVDYIRKFLKDLNFLEVETPMMNIIAGGTVSKPFITHDNELNKDLFLCVPPEIYLKQLVVGGLERVFEIGKRFSKKSIASGANPELATCEFYEAYADYHDLMDRTEQMLSGMVKELTGGYTVQYHANGFDNDPIEIDFTPPFRRIELIGELEKMSGLKIPKDLSSDTTNKYLLDACIKFDVKCPPPQTTLRLLNQLVEHFLDDTCVNPTFIIDHPEIMSHLGKSHRLKQGLTERFELFINKNQVCNAYTEVNDSVVQRQRFAEQLKNGQFADDEAKAAYCKALEYGLPPTAGWSLGIDHLMMLLTDSQDMKEVILFPAMNPRDEPAPPRCTIT